MSFRIVLGLIFSLGLAIFLLSCQSAPIVNTNNLSNANQGVLNHNSSPMNSIAISNNSAVNDNPPPSDSDSDEMPLESSPDAANQPYDLQFIDTMIQHHQASIVMAKMVLEKSQPAELKKFAQKIINQQEREIEQMEAWRDAWYPYKLDAINMDLPGMRESMKRMVGSEMDKMQIAEGEEFNDYFFDMMIPHQQGAVIMAKDALQKVQHPDLKNLGQEIIAAQEAEIKQMTEWREKVKSKKS